MSLSIFQKRLLQQNVELLKPDFHQFTHTFYHNLSQRNLTMTMPSEESVSKRSYILFCALNKVVSHLDDLPLVMPFIQYIANNLSFLNVSSHDIDHLCDAFFDTLESQQRGLNSHLKQAWSQAIRIFSNIVKSYLFAYSNVISINTRCANRLSS
ncbi:globin family protein [Pseudoalteromonas lipolytica]|uniref:Globin family profile domain-containing protein n=1 Tax=Pseudoalteromonas lipolytica TaxID=570156 RepID=A0ABY1GFG7_9GAMM|nr:hypothetical protein [Pseudoalteromonas lipolytica]SFT47225.1 hypothetical protein SAMN04487854_103170 [Pseudoalteromonas lipolytica]